MLTKALLSASSRDTLIQEDVVAALLWELAELPELVLHVCHLHQIIAKLAAYKVTVNSWGATRVVEVLLPVDAGDELGDDGGEGLEEAEE